MQCLFKIYEHLMISNFVHCGAEKYVEDTGELLPLKWDKRFHFIFTKYLNYSQLLIKE